MKILKLHKMNIDDFASVLGRFGEVHAPVRKDNSLNILDLVFKGKYPDSYFQTRHKDIAIVGVDCVPCQHRHS